MVCGGWGGGGRGGRNVYNSIVMVLSPMVSLDTTFSIQLNIQSKVDNIMIYTVYQSDQKFTCL